MLLFPIQEITTRELDGLNTAIAEDFDLRGTWRALLLESFFERCCTVVDVALAQAVMTTRKEFVTSLGAELLAGFFGDTRTTVTFTRTGMSTPGKWFATDFTTRDGAWIGAARNLHILNVASST